MRTASNILLFAGAVLLGACSDHATAPVAASHDTIVSGSGATADLTSQDTARFTLTINAEKPSLIWVGAGNWLTIPAHAVCDPRTSTYGPTEWDKPCAAAKYTISLKAKAWLDAKGHARVDFETPLRFVPSLIATQWVMLTFTDRGAAYGTDSKILYCETPTSACVDESATDPSLATVRDPLTGRLARRIKHFSGYNVFAGRDTDSGYDQ
jgi:hypothetical protein